MILLRDEILHQLMDIIYRAIYIPSGPNFQPSTAYSTLLQVVTRRLLQSTGDEITDKHTMSKVEEDFVIAANSACIELHSK